MRKLSEPRPATLRPAHDNPPAPGNPPPPARQLSGISTTTLRLRQPSATDPATLRNQHENPPAHDNSPRATTWAISTTKPARPRCRGAAPGRRSGRKPGDRQQRRDDAAPLQDQL